MKKVIFLIPNLKHGGAEEVLSNLVNNLDKSKYEVTLFQFLMLESIKSFLNKDVKYQYKFKKIFRANTYFLISFLLNFYTVG